MYKVVLSVVCALVVSGCATVLTGSNQSVKVSALSEDTHQTLSNVNCKVIDGSGVPHSLQANSGNISVSKSMSPMRVSCNAPGYQPYQGSINSNLNPVTVLNVLFWPGFFVDMATGAIQKYPSDYTVVMAEA